MTPKATLLEIELEKLVLDINNPRFAELYNGSKGEDDLIEYLLFTEAAEEVAERIVKVGEFYPDRPLWVIKSGKNYLVKDGNRRCAAVKALQMPGKYKLDLVKTEFNKLPVLLYKNQEDIDERIVEEHAGSLFRSWERIAKALEVLKLADNGRWIEAQDLDSKPGDLIKLATFYKEAVKYGGDDLRMLLRRGRGKTGGKTIIFERLFRDANLCGYSFKNSPSFRIEVKDLPKFESYTKAVVKYLKKVPGTTTKIIDDNKNFLKELEPFGFFAYEQVTSSSIQSTIHSKKPTELSGDSPSSSGVSLDGNLPEEQKPIGTSGIILTPVKTIPKTVRGSTKKYPITKRKSMPPGLKDLIKEYFDLDANIQTNSKIAMARVTFECILKYVIENTKFNNRTNMSKSGYFGPVYSNKKFTDFTQMKSKFTELITIPADKNAIKSFDLDHLHQIIHNYKVSAINTTASQVSNNLIEIIEFLLQDEKDLISSLDITKL